MKGIFVIRGTLTIFGSLGGDIDTIGSLGGDIDNEVVVWGGYVYFSLNKTISLLPGSPHQAWRHGIPRNSTYFAKSTQHYIVVSWNSLSNPQVTTTNLSVIVEAPNKELGMTIIPWVQCRRWLSAVSPISLHIIAIQL
jgi:hypothetical protein